VPSSKNVWVASCIVGLLVSVTPVLSWAQSSLWNDLKAMAEQVVRDKIKPAPATITATPPSQSPASSPATTSDNAPSSTVDRIEYDKISNNWNNNTPAIIENETAEMRRSGSGNVLILHPFQSTPAFIEKTITVGGSNTSLEFSVRGHPVGDFLARVVAVSQSGQQSVLYEKTIVGSHGWYAESIDLGRYRGQSVTLRFEVRATGWHFEYAGLDYFFVRGDANLPQSQQSTQAPVTTSANAGSLIEDTSASVSTYDFLFPLKGLGINLITEAGGISVDGRAIKTPCGQSEPYDDPCHHSNESFYALDFDAQNANVIAAGRGVIVYVSDPSDKYQQVVIKHTGGYFTVYAEHTIKPGLLRGAIEAGAVLGTLSGKRSEHLHFQVKYDPNGNGLTRGTSKNNIPQLVDITIAGRHFAEYKLKRSDTDFVRIQGVRQPKPLETQWPPEPQHGMILDGGATGDVRRAIGAISAQNT